jgi:ABC-type Fe3+ transport system substrate-binding protein
MKVFSKIEKVPASMRGTLDFLGQVHCPIKDRFAKAWGNFESRYNTGPAGKIRGLVPMGGCGADVYYNIDAAGPKEKFPLVITDTGYQDFFTGDFLGTPEKIAWFGPSGRDDPVHPLFRNLSLKDPLGIFQVFGTMPHVILVNHRRLRGRPVPRRVADLSAPRYENSLGVGFAEDDISEILLLEIAKEQGEAGVRGLARNIGFTGRPQDLAADAVAERDGCCVYFMSWFFAHAIPRRDYIEIIWPDDGAVFNPLYALFRKPETDRDYEVRDTCASFLFSPELAQSLAGGWFVHVRPEVSYDLPPEAAFRWVGWDYILEKPIVSRIREIEAVYYDERNSAARTKQPPAIRTA